MKFNHQGQKNKFEYVWKHYVQNLRDTSMAGARNRSFQVEVMKLIIDNDQGRI